jgi:hypothetical protein
MEKVIKNSPTAVDEGALPTQAKPVTAADTSSQPAASETVAEPRPSVPEDAAQSPCRKEADTQEPSPLSRAQARDTDGSHSGVVTEYDDEDAEEPDVVCVCLMRPRRRRPRRR